MDIIVVSQSLFILLLFASALAVPVARRLGLTAPVLFAAIGLGYGTATSILGGTLSERLLDSYELWFVQQLALNSDAILSVFLPVLLFDMALVINVRRLLDDVAVVLVMAVLAVALATVIIGGLLWLAAPVGLVACLLLGAAVATTDPGAVIATFREIGAPRRLLVILEGESLLNDAAAIAIFAVLVGLLRAELEPSALGVILSFLKSFGLGAAIGIIVAMVARQIYPFLVQSAVAEVSITVCVAYGAFIAAEEFAGVSGVVAVVFAGLATGSGGFLAMGPGNWATVRAVWAQIGFWASALIMILAMSLVPGLIGNFGWKFVLLVVIVYLAAMLARAVVLFGVVPFLSRLRLAQPIPPRQNVLILWGGVRGSVTLLLAISIAELSVLGDDARLLAALAASYTLATIFLNATTLAWLTSVLGLRSLSAGELAIREKIVAGSLERVRDVVRNLMRARDLEPQALAAAEAALGVQLEKVEANLAPDLTPFGDRLRMGLTIVAGQEARLIRRAFEESAIGPRAAGFLRLKADRIADAVRSGGRDAYETAALRAIEPSYGYRVAVRLQRFLRIDRPLRAAIELHLTGLLESERVVRELRGFVSSTVAPMVGDDAAGNLADLMVRRREAINHEIDAIAEQYPKYAIELEKALVMRAAIRRERQQYVRLYNDGVIEQELLEDLIADLDRRERVAARMPLLDLALSPREFLDRVPLFHELSLKQRRELSRRLRTRFSRPGEVILAEGTRSTDVFFVASGALEVAGPDGVSILGSGDFFGEIALVYPYRRRGTTVISRGYCRLLVLRRSDFARLAKRDPSVEQLIREAAERQIAEGYGRRKDPLP